MRLIDADELEWYKVPLAEPIKKPSSDDEVYAFRLGGNDAINTIMGYAPTVDPVKHGKWINDKGIYKCTVCNNLCTVAGWADCIPEKQMYKVFKFCPECGAKMDEVINEIN